MVPVETLPTPLVAVTLPEADPTVKREGVEEDHVPPADVSVSVVVVPEHNASVPPMAPGAGSSITVTEPTITLKQPVTVFVARAS
jgi:hypothetical protein